MTLPSSSSSTPSGCLSGVLRLLLCHTLRHTTTNATTPPSPTNPPPPPPPGIVARLMGLDSMPVCPYAPPPPPEHPILRSRSTNSLDTRPVLLTHKRTTSDPLAVLTKTPRSLSFREVPTYLRPENDDFLLLSFDPDDDGGLALPPESVLGAQTASKERRKRNDSSRVDNKVEDVEKSSVCQKRGDRRRGRKDGHGSKRKVEVVECSCSSSSSSQDSSPVSVLNPHWDVGAELSAAASTDISVSEHKDTKRKPKDSMRRKLPPDLEDRRDTSLSIHRARMSENGGKRGLEQEDKNPREAERDCLEFSYRLAEKDVKTSSWVPQRIQGFDDVWEIAAEIGLELLESLLYEAEKSELRDEKQRLRVEKENLELQIEMLNARLSFMPHPPVIPTTFGAHCQAAGAKAMMPFIGYPGYPM